MSIYVIGDLQGCFREFQRLVNTIRPTATDTLWFVGDLVNRGPQSLEVLRALQDLGDKAKVVLGNHDLHLLSVMFAGRPLNDYDTLQSILDAPDGEALCHWLRHQPLFYHHEPSGWSMVHAGLLPQWSISQAVALSGEVEAILQSDDHVTLYNHLYGNEPNLWQDDLTGWDRIRCIVNGFTRLRLCTAQGRCDFTYKGELGGQPEGLIPWFDVDNPAYGKANIAFGHWASLRGKTNQDHVVATDTGCVWGEQLTAVRLEDGKRFFVECN